MRSSLLAVAMCLPLFAPGAASAQVEELLYDPRNITEGLAVGLRVAFSPGMQATGQGAYEGISLATAWGTGGGLFLGYGATPRLLFFATADRTAHESDNAQIAGDITLYHFDFGARYHMHLRDVRYVPYVSLAVGGKQLYTKAFIDTLGVARPATINARAIVPGGGMQVFFTENFAVDGQLALSFGSFGKIDIDGDGRRSFRSDGGLTTRVMVGVTWYPDD